MDDVRPDGAGTAEAKREEDEAAARGLEEDRGGIQAAAGRRTQRVWPLRLPRRTLVCPRGGTAWPTPGRQRPPARGPAEGLRPPGHHGGRQRGQSLFQLLIHRDHKVKKLCDRVGHGSGHSNGWERGGGGGGDEDRRRREKKLQKLQSWSSRGGGHSHFMSLDDGLHFCFTTLVDAGVGFSHLVVVLEPSESFASVIA